METINVTVTASQIVADEHYAGAAGSIGTLQLALTFDGTWNGLTRRVTFLPPDGSGQEPSYIDLDDGNTATVPPAALAFAGDTRYSVSGSAYDANGNIVSRIVTGIEYITVAPSINGGAPAVSPTLSDFEQIQQAATQAASTATASADSAAVSAAAALAAEEGAVNGASPFVLKDNVPSYVDIAAIYPAPEVGWVTTANDTNTAYRYNGTEWQPIFHVQSTKTYTQNTAAKVWTVNHGMNKYPAVTVVDSAGTVVMCDVYYIDANNLSVTSSAAFAGKAYLN